MSSQLGSLFILLIFNIIVQLLQQTSHGIVNLIFNLFFICYYLRLFLFWILFCFCDGRGICVVFFEYNVEVYLHTYLRWKYWNQIRLQFKNTKKRMDYNINLQEQKEAYSPKSQPHIDHLQNVRIQKPEQNLSQIKSEPSSQKKVPSQSAENAPPTGCTKFCKLQFYEQFFQVTQQQVLNRIKLSFIPIKTQFIEELNGTPDLYGPFWLLTTIIFLVSSTGNLSRYFFNWTKDVYIFKLQLVRYAVLVVYSFGFGVPTVLYFAMKFLGVNRLSLPEIICLYGYSFSCFIPIFLLCIIPVPILQWLLISYGMINTSVFLIFNLKTHISELEPPKMYVLFGLIVGAQVALFLTFKLVFFRLVYEQTVV